MTGEEPPKFVRGYTTEDLTDSEYEQLQHWAVNNVKPSWLTGIGLLEAADQQVMEAVSNGNIEPPEEFSRADAVRCTLERLQQRYFETLGMLEKCVVRESLTKVSFINWIDEKGKPQRVMVNGPVDRTHLQGINTSVVDV